MELLKHLDKVAERVDAVPLAMGRHAKAPLPSPFDFLTQLLELLAALFYSALKPGNPLERPGHQGL